MEDLVKGLWQRDEKALEAVESQFAPLCRQIIDPLLRDPAGTDDVLNDTWFRIWNGIPPAKPKYLRAYVAKTARNAALNVIAREKAQKRSGVTVLLDELGECLPDPSSEREWETLPLRDTLNRFIRSLHGEKRSFFVRRYFFGESIREIAEAHNCTSSRVAVTLHRTREKLREILEKEQKEYDNA